MTSKKEGYGDGAEVHLSRVKFSGQIGPSGSPAPRRDNAALPTDAIKKGYLVVLYILEQLTMSSSHYISLLNLAQSWGLRGVEPTVCHSRIYGLPGIAKYCNGQRNDYADRENQHSNSDEVKYGTLYNLSYLNSELEMCLHTGGQEEACKVRKQYDTESAPCTIIESLNNFVHYSHRNVVLVYFIRGVGGALSKMTFIPREAALEVERRVVFPAGESIVECTHTVRDVGVANIVEQMLNKVVASVGNHTPPFVVQRVVCINKDNAEYGIDVSQLRDAVFQSSTNVSVIFTKWQNRAIFGEGSEILSKCKVSPLAHSQEVISASKLFLSSLDIKKPFMSVHLRLERFYQCEAPIPGYTECCVDRLASLLSTLKLKYQINDVLIIKDYGPYGTDSCTYQKNYVNISICLNLTKDFLSNLRQHGYHSSEFLPTTYDVKLPDNSGFVSLVEAHALLSGSVLIAGGFGSYQGTIIKQFLGIDDPNIGFKHFNSKQHDAYSGLYSRIYRVCTCNPLKGHVEQLDGVALEARSCDKL